MLRTLTLNINTMLSLQLHHIVNLYCWVDELIPKQLPNPQGGRPPVLTNSELVTLLIWNTLVLHQKTIKDLHNHVRLHMRQEFPRLPTYEAFLYHCHRVTPTMFVLLQHLLDGDALTKLMDSTMLPVCKLKRAQKHRVARDIAAFGKNHQGWHFGFKLHVSMNPQGQLSAVALTPANIHDQHLMSKIINQATKVAVGDTHYGGKDVTRQLWERQGTIVITPPHYKQRKKLAAPWQNELLDQRAKIEATFDVLKEHLHIVSSFPRSVFGYLVHYVRILLGYQVLALCVG